MSTPTPRTRTVSIEEAREHLDELVNKVAKGKSNVTIERDGKPLARLEPTVSAKQREVAAMLEEPTFRNLAAIGLAFEDVPLGELEEQVAKAIRTSRDKRQHGRTRTAST